MIAALAQSAKKYSFLLSQLIARDFKVKYKRSVLGMLWSLLYPVLMMCVMAVVFRGVFRFSTPGVSYLAYLMTGLTLFNYFSEASNLAMSSVVANFTLLNKVTLSTSPVKLFEYMAARKPILCSRMPECMRYRSVETYADPADFLRKAADLLERRGDPALLDLLDAEARANTWGARADEILCALESPLPAAEPTRRFPLGDKKAIPGI